MGVSKQRLLAFLGVVLPVAALVVTLSTPAAAATEDGCWFDDEYTSHGSCASNDCWFWQPGQRCRDGGWYGGCECAPIPGLD